MSIKESLAARLQVWHLLSATFVAVLGAAATIGAAWNSITTELTANRQRTSAVEDRVSRVEARGNRIERNIVRIGVKLGLQMEDPTD